MNAPDTPSAPERSHSFAEDAFAMVTGVMLVSLGVTLHAKTQLLTGGTAGLALLAQYLRVTDFATAFVLVNLPFYALAFLRLGWRLTVQTIVAVLLVAAMTRLTGAVIHIESVHPLYASIAGGLLIGVGLLILFRHKISLGGVNILALYAQERFGLSAGKVQLGIDLTILAAAWFVVGGDKVGLSVLAAAVLNGVIAINHRPGRYTGIS
jgi:uncharacterized membrane-anchored protein YitT (DUF2179 family)